MCENAALFLLMWANSTALAQQRYGLNSDSWQSAEKWIFLQLSMGAI
jgi:hypothetical protein